MGFSTHPTKDQSTMAKYIRGSAPKSFSHKVTFDVLSGGKADVTMSYRYRTSSQQAAFVAEIHPELIDGPKENADAGVDVVALNAQALARSVKYIMGAAEGWNLEDDFNEANVRQFCDEQPAGAQAVINAYRTALSEGRAKN